MSDSLFIPVIVGVFAVVAIVVYFLFMRWPRAMFDDRQSVQQAVSSHMKQNSDASQDVAWCAPVEDGLYGVFELRDHRFGIVQGTRRGPRVRLLKAGDIKLLTPSKDGFALTVRPSNPLKQKMKLVFDDVATATHARNVLANAIASLD